MSAQQEATISFLYLDDSGLVSQTLGTDSGGTAVTDREAAIDAVRAGDSEAFIYIPASPSSTQSRSTERTRACSRAPNTVPWPAA